MTAAALERAKDLLGATCLEIEAAAGEASPFGAIVLLPVLIEALGRHGHAHHLGDLCDHFVEMAAWSRGMAEIGAVVPADLQALFDAKGARLIAAFLSGTSDEVPL